MFDTITALATAPMLSAIAVIRVSGDAALEIVSRCFSKELTTMQERQIVYGYILDGQEKIDEVLLNVYPGTKSYTGENLVEIQSHGSMIIVRQILALLVKKGARIAEKGEFTARAFYHGKMDLVQAEAVNDMIHAKTEEAKSLALLSLEGKTSHALMPIKEAIADLLSHIEVNIDYPEYEDIEQVTTEEVITTVRTLQHMIQQLIQDGKQGQRIRDGLTIAIVGKPNVGKSSLLNALMEENKAIVTDIAGTTRDIVEGELQFRGIPLHVLDTAGIHASHDQIESIGIEKANQAIEKADLVFLVLDGSQEEDEEDRYLLHITENKTRLLIYNKEDQIESTKKDQQKLYISAKEGKIEALKESLWEMLALDEQAYKRPSFANERQLGLLGKVEQELQKAKDDALQGYTLDLVAVAVQEAYQNILEILGESKGNDFSEEIFSRFCVGK